MQRYALNSPNQIVDKEIRLNNVNIEHILSIERFTANRTSSLSRVDETLNS
jgi:hypothetical protein